MEPGKKKTLPILCGAMYLLFLFCLIKQYETLELYGFRFSRFGTAFSVLAYALLSAGLFLEKRLSKKTSRVLLALGFGVLAVKYTVNYTYSLLLNGETTLGEFLSMLTLMFSVLFAAILSLVAIHNERAIRKIWWIPGVSYLLFSIFETICFGLIYFEIYWWYFFATVFSSLLFVIATLLTMAHVANLGDGVTVKNRGYFSLFWHIMLLLFSFGIWYFVWIFRTTAVLNDPEEGEKRNPMTKTLLCLFVPFYTVFWTYKSAEFCDRRAQRKGLPSNIATLCLILAIFFPLIPPILIQDKINSIARRPAVVPPPSPAPAAARASEDAQLIRLKGLLDAGVITREEFEEKRKELLGF